MEWRDYDWAESERADGRVTCCVCGRPYDRHPEAENHDAMHRICTGAWPREGKPDVRWVKT